jgi:hypothetical protein
LKSLLLACPIPNHIPNPATKDEVLTALRWPGNKCGHLPGFFGSRNSMRSVHPVVHIHLHSAVYFAECFSLYGEFILFPVDGHLDCFQLGAVINKVAEEDSYTIQTILWACVFIRLW